AKALMRYFMDHVLRGVENRFATLPPVRLEVRSARDTVHTVRWEADWPLPDTDYRALHLAEGGLAATPPAAPAEIAYAAADGLATFDHVFEEDTELTGYMKLRLWVEVRPAAPGAAPGAVQPDDMILCIFVDKLDRDGRSVRFNGTIGTTDDVVTRGYLRVSRRALDPVASTAWLPVPLGTGEERLAPGEIVPVEIALRPSATAFAAGESLRLVVSGRELHHAPVFRKDTSLNAGRHILHFGGDFDAHLLVPVVPEPY
ncbi:MAG: CocE/NonD family hydrolase, partial [Pseudomonadota bacterium]